ncbi:MAG TPA: hypothetical protein VHE55_02885 [Fimbriimonadaceae bacterium]|nr:hypothetical protein [Fimbriimonadaceae bacterium]
MDPNSASRLADVLLDQAAGQTEFDIDLLDEAATQALIVALQGRGCTVVRDGFKTVLKVIPPAAKLDVS